MTRFSNIKLFFIYFIFFHIGLSLNSVLILHSTMSIDNAVKFNVFKISLIFLLQHKDQLTDTDVAKLAYNIPATSMKTIALMYLGLRGAKVHNIDMQNHRDPERFNYDLLIHWRSTNPENNKQVTEVNHLIDSRE